MYNPQPFQEKRDIMPAIAWYKKHKMHVDKLVEECDGPAYPPCGSDCIRPELWKPNHWKWFIREKKFVEEK